MRPTPLRAIRARTAPVRRRRALPCSPNGTAQGYYDGGRTIDPSFNCGGQPADAQNARYCPADDTLAWDVQLMRKGEKDGRHRLGHGLTGPVPLLRLTARRASLRWLDLQPLSEPTRVGLVWRASTTSPQVSHTSPTTRGWSLLCWSTSGGPSSPTRCRSPQRIRVRMTG